MKKNQTQFQKGYSLAELFTHFGTEDQCLQALISAKWPNGFICPECGSTCYCTLKTRKLFQCQQCHHQSSALVGTIFESTKLPLTQWFLAIYLITQSKSGLSALALKRQIGVSYNTAWAIKHKIMQVMKEQDDKRPLSGLIQIDDAYYGGEKRGGKRGRGSENKTPFVAAVATNASGHPTYMNFHVVKGFRAAEISRWAKKHLKAGSYVASDGLACFSSVKDAGCEHAKYVTGGGVLSVEKPEFLWVNTMIGNVKNSITGSYHSIQSKHLPRYLAEFCYRFNRRFELDKMLPRLLFAATRTAPMPIRLLKLAEDYG